MRRRFAFVLLLASLVLVAGCAAGARDNAASLQMQQAIVRARDRVYPATVRIEARKTEYFRGQKKRVGGFGSGVIFSPEGYVLTNYHVAGRAKELSCTLYNKERVKAELVGGDPWTDLAVIQLDLDEVRDKGIDFQWAEFGDSDRMREGHHVLAIGSPFGLSRSVSYGVISCHDRILSEGMKLGGGLETGLFNTWLQTDAAINPGNSGGPLVNLDGEVVGINTRGGGNDLGFAVPINVARGVVDQLLASGEVRRSTLGLKFQPLRDLEEFFDVSKTEGAIISAVEGGMPAEQAGVESQDVLVALDGRRVEGRYPEELFDLRRAITDLPVGETVTLTVRRGSGRLDIPATTVALTTVRSDETNFAEWGLVGQNITPRLAARENLESTEGIYVTGVRRGEPADEVDIDEGDVIVRVGSETVDDVEGLQGLYDRLIEQRRPMVGLTIRRGRAMLPKVLKIDYDEPADAAEDVDAEPMAGDSENE